MDNFNYIRHHVQTQYGYNYNEYFSINEDFIMNFM